MTEFDRTLEHGEETEEDRDLSEHREASCDRVNTIFREELHLLLLHLLGITFVFFLELLNLRLEL